MSATLAAGLAVGAMAFIAGISTIATANMGEPYSEEKMIEQRTALDTGSPQLTYGTEQVAYVHECASSMPQMIARRK